MNAIPFLILALVFGPWMIFEGLQIVAFQKQIVPTPKRILIWLGLLVFGKEKSNPWFTGQETPQNQRTYGYAAVVFGGLMVVAAIVNLVWMLR